MLPRPFHPYRVSDRQGTCNRPAKVTSVNMAGKQRENLARERGCGLIQPLMESVKMLDCENVKGVPKAPPNV